MLPNDAQMRMLFASGKVAEVEDGGLDDERFFVHLAHGRDFKTDPLQKVSSKSFSSFTEALSAVRRAA